MHTIERSALVAHSCEQMFDLVNDIEAYPNYMEGCNGARILEHHPDCVVARLELSRLGIRHCFTTRNMLQRPTAMDMQLVEGPFREFNGFWEFLALSPDACKVSLTLEFALSNALLGKAAARWFESVANELVDGVCRRANRVYG